MFSRYTMYKYGIYPCRAKSINTELLINHKNTVGKHNIYENCKTINEAKSRYATEYYIIHT